MADIARRLNLPHATIRNYFGGRMPSPEVLIKIADETNVSLNWLLMGSGEMFPSGSKAVDIGKLIDERIEKIVDQKLLQISVPNERPIAAPLSAPAFDVARSIAQYNDPHRTMRDWFAFEGRDHPRDFGVVFFRGWETFTDQEKLDAVNDAKKVLDRSLRNS